MPDGLLLGLFLGSPIPSSFAIHTENAAEDGFALNTLGLKMRFPGVLARVKNGSFNSHCGMDSTPLQCVKFLERRSLRCSNFLAPRDRRHITRSAQAAILQVLTPAENWHAKCLTRVASLFKQSEERLALWGLMMIATNDEATGFDLTKALVISASEGNRAALSDALSAEGFVPIPCASMTEARKFIRSDDIGIVFCDDCLSDGCLKTVVDEAGKRQRPVPVIAVSRTGEWHEYFEALRMGAFDYLSLPPRRHELDRILASALGGTERLNNSAKEAAI